jgi:dCTP deaminase
MILTREEIIKRDEIVIEPWNDSLIGINSVDVRLGGDLWELQPLYKRSKPYRDLYNPEDTAWVKVEPISAKNVRMGYKEWAVGIVPDDAECFILKGGSFYLATTLEKIGTKPPSPGEPSIIPEMKAKSTIGRSGMTVSLCAGLGDVGFRSRWALEVRVTDDGPIPIAIGTPIGQVVFHLGTPTKMMYDGEDRYQYKDQVKFLPKPLPYMGTK